MASPGFASPTTPGTAMLAELLDAAAHEAVAQTRKNVQRPARHVPPAVVPAARVDDSSWSGAAAASTASDDGASQLSAADGITQNVALQAMHEVAFAELQRSESQQQQQLELHAQVAELQLCFLQLHEQQQALIATHHAQRRAEAGGDGVQPCACVIS